MTRCASLLLIGCLLLAGIACRAGSDSRRGGNVPDSATFPTAEAPADAADDDPLPTLPTGAAPGQSEAPAPSQTAAPAVAPTPTATPRTAETEDGAALSDGDALLDLLDNLATANAEADDLNDIDELDP